MIDDPYLVVRSSDEYYSIYQSSLAAVRLRGVWSFVVTSLHFVHTILTCRDVFVPSSLHVVC